MSKNVVIVELFYNGVWNSITDLDEVFTDSPITIIQGQSDENSGLRPCSVSLRLNNASDKYRISNPMSPLYRLVGRNTPIRVWNGGSIRVVAEINSWKCDQTQDFRATPRRGKSWTDITATGILGRVNTWTKNLRSPIYRYVIASDPATYNLVEYWSMEVPSNKDTAPSSVGGIDMKPVSIARYTLPDGSVLPPGGSPSFGSGNKIPGSDSLPGFQSGGTLSAPVRTSTFNGYAIDWFMQFEAGSSDAILSADVLNWKESGTYVSFTVNVSPGFVTVFHSNAIDEKTLAATGSCTATFDMFDGAPHHFRYQVRQNGGNYQAELYIDSGLYATATNFVPPMAGTVGRPTSIQWNPGEDRGDYMPVACGHLAIWGSGQIGGQPPIFFALNGWAIEKAGPRLDRIFDEEGIPLSLVGTSSNSKQMGPQKSDTLYNTTVEIKTTEDGLIYDDRGSLAVIFKLLSYRYNQAATLTLYPSDFPRLPKEFTDNSDVHNVITVTQRDGNSVTTEDSTGYLGTQAPPLGVNDIKDEVAVNLFDPVNLLPQHANWWLRRGTVDLPKYPELVLDLNASPQLESAVGSLFVGNVIEIKGFRENTIRLFILGWTEVIGTHGRIITFICKPTQQFDVGKYSDGVSRFDSHYTTNKTALGKTDTSMTFRTSNRDSLWSQTSVPYDVMCSGERITVNSMGASSLVSGSYDQVANVVRSVNAIIKTISAGESIRIATPARYAL